MVKHFNGYPVAYKRNAKTKLLWLHKENFLNTWEGFPNLMAKAEDYDERIEA